MKTIRKAVFISFIFISILGAVTLDPKTLYAAIGVSPENMEIMVSQGSEKKGEYAVLNDSDEPIHVNVEVEDWLKMRTGKTGIPVESWLKIKPVEFDIGPKETKKIEYVITPPRDQEGELAAMVYFGTTSPEGTFNITSRFGVSIYVAIENTISLDCGINKVVVARDVRDPEKEPDLRSKSLVFGVEVVNKGNVHIRPTGNIEITAQSGEKYNVKVERGFPVYAGKNFNYSIPWNKTDLAPGKYKVDVVLDCGNIYKLDKRCEKKVSFTAEEDGSISF